MTQPIKVCFLTYRLQIGGAERQIGLIASRLDRTKFDPVVITAYSGGGLEEDLMRSGVRIVSAAKRGRLDIIGFWLRLARIVRQERPDIVYSMSDYANVLGQTLRTLGGHYKTIWGLRASDNKPWERGIVWYGVFRLARVMSRWSDRMISNSEAGLNYYRKAGFHTRSAIVIPNGIEIDRNAPNRNMREAARREWEVGDEFVVGFFSRIQPKKDLPCFLAAASELVDQPGIRFVVAGSDGSRYAADLKEKAATELPRLIWLGERLDAPVVMNGFDMYCLTSAYGEGHPNTLGEAMAVGLIVAASDCGDARQMIGDDDWVFGPGDYRHMAELIRRAAALSPEERHDIAARNRRRAIAEFSEGKLIEETQMQLSLLAAEGRSTSWSSDGR
jgi:glycosyltransferase involved in cell wall biosynthesis